VAAYPSVSIQGPKYDSQRAKVKKCLDAEDGDVTKQEWFFPQNWFRH